ncbi:MAG: hypothetical protein ACYSWZ_00380 [Planctomycetota bacterium]|jgi:hypothetical protein
MNDIELVFEPHKSSSPTKGLLMVRQGDEILTTDTLDIANNKRQKEFIRNLIKQCPGLEKFKEQLHKQLLEVIAEQIQKSQENPGPSDITGQDQPLNKSKAALVETDPEVVKLAERLLRSPDLIQKMVDHAHILGVAGEDQLVIAVYVIGTSRLLTKPLAGLVMGVSSAGKSFVINTVSRLFPNEAVLRAHRITPQALQYLPEGYLIHRFVVAGERSRMRDDAAAEATRALREMISDGRLSTLVTVSHGFGVHQSAHIEQEGPIAYIESTTMGVEDIFNEDRTRFMLLCSDEGIAQSRAVVDKIAQSVSVPADPDTPDSIIALHNTAQRLLRPLDVVIPFAGQLKDCLPLECVEVRRTFGHMMNLIQAVALLHQFQRKQNEAGQIIATPLDYGIVRKYLAEPLATSLGRVLTPGAKLLLEKVSSMSEYTLAEAEAVVPFKIGTVRSRNRELLAAGQIRQTEQARGQLAAKYVAVEDPPALNGFVLPELKTEDYDNFLLETVLIDADKT